MRNFQILIVSEVKFCKQCLQTASAAGNFVPQTLYRGFAPKLHWDTSALQNPWAIYSTELKFLLSPLWVGLVEPLTINTQVRHSRDKFEQVTNLLCAQANSASLSSRNE